MFRTIAALCVFLTIGFLLSTFTPSFWSHGFSFADNAIWTTKSFILFRYGVLVAMGLGIVTFIKLK